jgi:23S rRNA (uracil1939-C5)-methyltransferase
LQLEGKIAGILHTRNDSLSDAIIDQGTRILYGKDYFYEELLGLKFKISPFSFFQTNSLGAEVLYTAAREFVAESGNGKIVYDLYSGTGTIAQMLAPVAKKVIGVEIVAEAVEAARENAAENGLSNCEFIAGDVLKVLDEIEEKPEFIVLDPPRDGIHPKVLDMLGKHYEVEKMVYISCKPTSLARDLAKLQEYGYRVERVCCVDMFPGTTHVESVVLLSKVQN